jgi:hypothetical protein
MWGLDKLGRMESGANIYFLIFTTSSLCKFARARVTKEFLPKFLKPHTLHCAEMASLASQRCRSCDHPRPDTTSPAMIMTNLSDMSQKAAKGCHTCAILHNGVKQVIGEHSDSDDGNRLRIDFNVAASVPSLHVHDFNTETTTAFFREEGELCPNTKPFREADLDGRIYVKGSNQTLRSMPDLPPGLDIPSNTSSEQSMLWLLDQLHSCRKHHSCGSSNELPLLPHRVLDVEQAASDVVRLRTGLSERAQYACLSHCWGRAPFLCTKSENLESHEAEIPWENLPLTFQETISVVRRLGIRYLWIDSLCIIQDSENDWRNNAANMGRIFQESLLTITAAKSKSAHDGLFSNDLPVAYRLKAVTRHSCANSETQEPVFVRRALPHLQGHARFGSQVPGGGQDFPTLTRGWILQERMLAPRVVHFGPQELVWECLQSSACQCTAPSARQTGLPEAHHWKQYSISWPKRYFAKTSWHLMDENERVTAWHRLVEQYTQLELTFGKDTFPAVAGLAAEFGAVRATKGQYRVGTKGYRYLAGLWEDTLLRDLLWHVSTDVSEEGAPKDWRRRPPKWRAPSWSWASVNTAVTFEESLGGLLSSCEVLGAESTPVGPDAMGEVTGAHLCLRGRLIPTTMRRRAGDGRDAWRLLQLGLMKRLMGNLWADYDCFDCGDVDPSQDTDVFCFILGLKQPSQALFCLILKDTSNSTRRKFERLGLLEIFAGPPSSASSPWLDGLLGTGSIADICVV